MPHHAQLPVWDDRNPEEKIQALQHLVEDLYGYVLAEARSKILHILHHAEPADEKESADIQKMIQMVQKYPNILAQNCEVGHVTGSALVVDVTRGGVLLHLHKRLNKWLQFGGHADYETDFAAVALREAQEETGLQDLRHYLTGSEPIPLDFDIHTIPQSTDRPEHLHLDFRYLLVTEQSEAARPDPEESLDFKFISFADLDQLAADAQLEPALRRLISKAEEALLS